MSENIDEIQEQVDTMKMELVKDVVDEIELEETMDKGDEENEDNDDIENFTIDPIQKYQFKYTVKKNPDEYPALAGLQRSLQIELDFYPADSHPARAG